MLSCTIRSEEAVRVNIAIMRNFRSASWRRSRFTRNSPANWTDLEKRIEGHDTAIQSLFWEAMRRLMSPPPAPPKPEIGFHVKENPLALPHKARPS